MSNFILGIVTAILLTISICGLVSIAKCFMDDYVDGLIRKHEKAQYGSRWMAKDIAEIVGDVYPQLKRTTKK